MKKFVIMLCCLITYMQLGEREVMATVYYGDIGPPKDNEVHIGKAGIEMPAGRILIVRKDLEYCAVKFTEFWSGKTEEEFYATYESYYQSDKTGDFTKKNVLFKKEKLSASKLYGIGRFSFRFGEPDIRCGHIKLFWFGKGSISFYSLNQDAGDYGIELAPTKWTDISQVNVFDPMLRWYRYDTRRKSTNISVDELFTAPLIAKSGEDIARQENVYVKADAVGVPVGRITLIRNGLKHCAVKFTDAWVEQMSGSLTYSADYESYYQGDKTGDFNSKNVKFKKDHLLSIPNSILTSLRFGDIDCVKMTLNWSASNEANWMYFALYQKAPGDYSIELAPTIWTDISQVNVFDPRIKWYRYDEKRERINIPIDKIWENKTENKK